MKQVSTLLLLALGQMAFAQAGDTLGVTIGTTPTFAPNNQAVLYQDAEGGYIFGTNAQAQNALTGIAQAYVNLEPVRVTAALAFIKKKGKGPSATESKLTFTVHNVDPTAALTYTGPPNAPVFQNVPGPGTAVLATAEVFYSEIDTATAAYTVATFTNAPICNGDLAIACNLNNFKTLGDTVGFLGDVQGSGLGMRYTYHQATQGASTVWFPTDFLFTGTNCNVSIFAVTEEITSVENLDQATFVQGIRALAFPNPAESACQLQFELQEAGELRFDLIASDGRLAMSRDWGKRAAGAYTETLDLSGLAAGLYYYSISSDTGSRITQQLVVR